VRASHGNTFFFFLFFFLLLLRQRMNQLQSSYVKGRERELNQKHNAGKKRFTPDTPDKVRYLHSKFRQVFQPFGKNREKYADRNQTKTQSVHGHKDSQQPKSL